MHIIMIPAEIYIPLNPVKGMISPMRYGPKPTPASRQIKKVAVAKPTCSLGDTFMAIAWIQDIKVPKPKAKSTADTSKTTLFSVSPINTRLIEKKKIDG